MRREEALAKNTAILMFGRLCTQGISFLLLPLYTSILSAEEYGIFDIMITYSTLLLPLVNWQFDQGVFRFVLERRGDKNAITKVFSTMLFSCVLQTVAYVVIIFAINVLHPIDNADFLCLYVCLLVFSSLLLQFARGIGKSTYYAAASFISATATVVFNVIALVILHMGVKGLFLACIVGQFLTIFYLVLKNRIWEYIHISEINHKTYKEVCRYSLPLIPNNLAWWVVNASDRMVIRHFIGLAANGIYTVACKFPNVFITFYNVVNLSWTESVSLHFNDEDRDSFLNEVMITFFKLFASCCYLIIAFMPFIFPIMVNSKFELSYNHIYILMMGMLFRVMVGLYSCIYIATKQSKKVASTSIAAAVINLSVNLILVNRIGLYAASVSTLVAFLTMFIIRYVDVNRIVQMRGDYKTYFLTFILGIGIGIAYYSNSKPFQVLALVTVLIYSVIENISFIKTGLALVKKYMLKIRMKS